MNRCSYPLGPGGARLAGAAGLLLLLFPGAHAASERAEIPDPSFEAGETTAEAWTAAGDVTLDGQQKVDGARSLRLRRDAATLPVTRAESRRFPIRPGVWELSGAYASELYSPDVSFNVSIRLTSFDAAGSMLKERRLLAAVGRNAWTHFKERLDVPPGAASASIAIEFNKSHGEFRADAFALEYIGASVPMPGGDRKAVFRTNRVGNLFYPGDRVAFELELETPAELAGARLRTRWQVTDFYQAPASAPQTLELTPAGETARGWRRYQATFDLSALPLRVGPYYELQMVLDLGADTAAREAVSFAILREAVTRELDPLATPFGAHTWNATVYEYFPLAARLGLRRCLVFWDWPAEPPYTPDFDSGHRRASRLEWPKRFGLAPYGMLYPVNRIEHQEGPGYSAEALREGVRQSIEKYRRDGLWGFQIGNEPPSWNPEWVQRDVEAYKTVYEAIKQTDPNFVVIGSAIGPNETFFKAGFQEYQDVYNVHAYSDLGELRAQMRRYREMFQKYGGEKPIWSTEIGSKSQGLPRDVIARDLVRKAVCFFADGGGFFTWFAVGGMPDPEGERTGSYSDSMDLFAAKYDMHQPRLDAVAFYHLINTLAAKRFVAEKTYADGAHGFLFRDAQDNALMVFWTDARAADVFVPLPGVNEVALRWFDGASRRMQARERGVGLRLGEDPVFVSFRGGAVDLPAELAAPGATIESAPAALRQGETAELIVRTEPATGPLRLAGPATWTLAPPTERPTANGARELAWRIAVPAETMTRAATFTVSDETVTSPGHTELRFTIPIESRIELDFMPVAGVREGDAAVRLRWRNHSDQAQTVDWKIEIVDELPMANGTHKVADAKPSTAFFDGVANGQLTLGAQAAQETTLALGGVDRQTIYRLRATATDAAGNSVQRERRVGGFARAVAAAKKPTLDGRLDDPLWQQAPRYRLDEFRQFRVVEKSAKPWAGPADLSGSVRFAWDADALYVAVEVTDDVFVNPAADGRLWTQDGLQFLFDPFRAEKQSRGRYDYSLGIGQKGPQVWCHMTADPRVPNGLVAEIVLAATAPHAGRGDRNYEVAIPWSRLAPFQPESGANLGATMVLNENDGAGRQSTMGWFGGVHLKETNFVGDIVLQ